MHPEVSASSRARPLDDLIHVMMPARRGVTVLRCDALTFDGFDIVADRPFNPGRPYPFEFTCTTTGFSVVLWATCVHCRAVGTEHLRFASAWEFMSEVTDAWAGIETLVACVNARRPISEDAA